MKQMKQEGEGEVNKNRDYLKKNLRIGEILLKNLIKFDVSLLVSLR